MYRHVARLVEMLLPLDDARLRAELLPVLHWIDRDAGLAPFTRGQRARGWDWLVQRGAAWHRRAEAGAAAQAAWPAPSQPLHVGRFDAFVLGSTLALLHEGWAMRHCIVDYEEECQSGECAVLSLRCRTNEQRRATALLRRSPPEGGWQFGEARGFANSDVSAAMMAAAREAARRLAPEGDRWLGPCR